VIGVNRGSLGFLTTFSADEARAHFTALLRGEFTVEHRSLIRCSTGPDQHGLALNDVLIKSEVNSRLAVLEVFADGQLVTEYHCDGLIFSTPTGSTAYNLSAGGPLVHPAARVIAMTPICPHTLSNRSIIFREDVHLQVYNRGGPARLVVAADGQRNLVSCETSPVEISIARQTLPLAHLPGYDHFSVLRTKLRWSGGYAERPR
jgi:NAD+ kinase